MEYLEVIDIREVSLDWYKDWWYRHKDYLYGKDIRSSINCRYGKCISLEFFVNQYRKNVVLIVTSRDPMKLSNAFEYLDDHSVMEFFRDWNNVKRQKVNGKCLRVKDKK